MKTSWVCSQLPPPPAEPAPPPPEHSSLPTESSLLHGTGLSYYDVSLNSCHYLMPNNYNNDQMYVILITNSLVPHFVTFIFFLNNNKSTQNLMTSFFLELASKKILSLPKKFFCSIPSWFQVFYDKGCQLPTSSNPVLGSYFLVSINIGHILFFYLLSLFLLALTAILHIQYLLYNSNSYIDLIKRV